MKALIYRRFGSADELEWADGWPEPELSSGSVVVRAVAGSVNPKDVLLRKGKFSRTLARDPLPRVTGLDVAGGIVAVGRDVVDCAEGDAVFGMTNRFCGGVHSELAKLDQGELARAPSNTSLTEAATVPLAAQTALQALRDCCAVEHGQRVLVNGASGGVGHFAVQIAKALGGEVHAVCGPRNVAFVESLGADAVYSYAEQPPGTIGQSFDAVFDVFGNLSRSMLAGQLGGRGIYVSTVPKPATLWTEAMARLGLSRTGRLVQVQSRSADLERIRGWIEGGQVVPHLEKVYPIEQAGDAHRHIESRRTVGKVCITFPAPAGSGTEGPDIRASGTTGE
jgi:NADPH:quinone reductase-like Zn-dependent oxidoreductase